MFKSKQTLDICPECILLFMITGENALTRTEAPYLLIVRASSDIHRSITATITVTASKLEGR